MPMPMPIPERSPRRCSLSSPDLPNMAARPPLLPPPAAAVRGLPGEGAVAAVSRAGRARAGSGRGRGAGPGGAGRSRRRALWQALGQQTAAVPGCRARRSPSHRRRGAGTETASPRRGDAERAALESPYRPHTCALRGRRVGVAAADHLGTRPAAPPPPVLARPGKAPPPLRAIELRAAAGSRTGARGRSEARAAAPVGLARSRQPGRGGQEGRRPPAGGARSAGR